MAVHTTSATPAGKRRWSGHDLRDSLKEGVKLRQNYQCAYCNTVTQTGHIDHVTPRVAGGTNTADNLVYACRGCNLKKSDTPIEVWLARRPTTLAKVQQITQTPVDRKAGLAAAKRRAEIKASLRQWSQA